MLQRRRNVKVYSMLWIQEPLIGYRLSLKICIQLIGSYQRLGHNALKFSVEALKEKLSTCSMIKDD